MHSNISTYCAYSGMLVQANALNFVYFASVPRKGNLGGPMHVVFRSQSRVRVFSSLRWKYKQSRAGIWMPVNPERQS